MSKEVAITAIAHPAPGKLERFKEAVKTATEWIEANEPETLQFEVYEEKEAGEEGVKISLFERYASQEALERHQNSESYKKFFGTVMDEGLLTGAPQIIKGKRVCAFNRK